MNTLQNLFWNLYNANSEEEITKLINTNKLLNDQSNWTPYGNNKGNFGTFESQQNHPVPALIEKITNSIDATLIKECRILGIDPKSAKAPKNMTDAVEQFYNIQDGEIGLFSPTERRVLGENIQILAVGDKQQPSLVIYDNGEGQHPNNFKNTFLSLHSNNKTNIHFVQGKYNMGSTGAVVFCGENKYQLLASKRNSLINTEDTNLFGFTLVRRHPLSAEEELDYGKATWYEYFSPEGEIAAFDIKELDLGLYNRMFISGSIVKLYSYQLPKGSRSNITFDLWRDLNQYMYQLPLPITLFEKRDYINKNPTKLVLGNKTRITIDSRENVSQIISFHIPKEAGLGDIPIDVIIFNPKVDHNEFIKNKSIIYTQNGQVHGYEGQSFISQDLGFSLLKKNMLINVDCSNISTTIRQDLFMANRTHLKNGNKAEHLRGEIISLLKHSEQLKDLNEQMKNFLLQDSESDRSLIENLLAKLPVDKDVLELLKRDGSLDFLHQKGKSNQAKHPTDEGPKLNRFPAIFEMDLEEGEFSKSYKTIPLNSNGIVKIKTDVEDDYLFRTTDKGRLEIQVMKKGNINDTEILDTSKPNPNPVVVSDILTIKREGPSGGNVKLIIEPNENAKVGDEVEVKARLTDSHGTQMECVFNVKVDKEISKPTKKEKVHNETFPNLPTPKKAYEKAHDTETLTWNSPELNWTGTDIVKIITSADTTNNLMVAGIIVNMDSFALKNFMDKNKIQTENEIRFTKDKYFISVYLHSLFLFSIMQKMRKTDEKLKGIEVDEFISSMIKPYASFLMYENHHVTKMAFSEN